MPLKTLVDSYADYAVHIQLVEIPFVQHGLAQEKTTNAASWCDTLGLWRLETWKRRL